MAVPAGRRRGHVPGGVPQPSWLAQVIQVNINNLAGVPSVVFGILGAFVFVELIFKPLESGDRSPPATSLGGGLTLALLTLPVVIVSAQEAIRAVPVVDPPRRPYALGATRWQVIWQHGPAVGAARAS